MITSRLSLCGGWIVGKADIRADTELQVRHDGHGGYDHSLTFFFNLM
jgi:hypothetical protein